MNSNDSERPDVQVRFYFDPLCPWCWITSFWLDEVAPHRDLEVDWRSISLLVRNEGRDVDPEYAERYLPAMQRSFGLLRIVEALRADGHADRIRDVYVAFGRHFHQPDAESGEAGLDFDIAEALRSAGVDDGYAKAYDDTAYDAAVRASTREAEEVAGDDVGTPIVAVQVGDEWKGYFGPVIPSVIRGDEALRLWDGLAALVQTEGFYELKRTRTVGPQLETVPLDQRRPAGPGRQSD
ncbi:DsbA family protein [Euzebya sp.]|uniref:mycothiol-dependent nitroreductase Rv2466c family protein n=1 Tax=Euzebya sp. TaxID=1971409 RepID=UPI0035119C79